ncbi:collagen-like repeat preface domain-containing protein [Paenibacillus larvae]|uniref:collagen-like repeat preface domain-containing protein n=1 Tax=Paenibacillus larvae TaxID=1464 RepID=UPI002281FC51|nr:collagen-like repeat preface domain-containing protein [Paenibacillus larvae]MCY9511781.1 collagen-like repeat preface domain-containing protein [Paenibacillus larvae]MCY9527175.1 collagen-like repeat preface domain-containing protein [Paenibacillus larvae]
MRKRDRKHPPASHLSEARRHLPVQKKGRQRGDSRGWNKWQEAYQRLFNTHLPDGSTDIVFTSSQADDLVKLLEVLSAEIPLALSNPNPASMSRLHSLFHQFRALFFTIPLPVSQAESNCSYIDDVLSLLHSFPYPAFDLAGRIQYWLDGLDMIFTGLRTGEVYKEKLLNALKSVVGQIKESYPVSEEEVILFPESLIQPFIHLLQNLPVGICLALVNKDSDSIRRLKNMVAQLAFMFSQIRLDPDSFTLISTLIGRVQSLLHQTPLPAKELISQLTGLLHEICIRIPLFNVRFQAKQTITTLLQSVQESIGKVSGNLANGRT